MGLYFQGAPQLFKVTAFWDLASGLSQVSYYFVHSYCVYGWVGVITFEACCFEIGSHVHWASLKLST